MSDPKAPPPLPVLTGPARQRLIRALARALREERDAAQQVDAQRRLR